jgi:hypothetical protein
MFLALAAAPWETIGIVAGVIVALTLIYCVFKLARDRDIR